MKRALVFFLLLAVFGVAPRASAANPISLDEYRRAVAQSLALVQQAVALAPDARADVLNQAAAQLEPIASVQLPSGAETTVNNAALIALIRDPRQTPSAVTRLTALRDALAQPLPVVSANDLAALDSIFSRPPFVDPNSTLPAWLKDLIQFISDFFNRLVTNTARGVFDLRDIIMLIGIVLVFGVLIYFVRNLRRNMVQEQALELLPETHEARTPTEAFNNAQLFVNQGDYRNAVRQLYLATLLLLDQRGKLKYDPTLTNREYLHQTSNDPRTTAALVPIVETFDRTWYGFEDISRQEFDAYRARVEQVREL